MLSPEIVKEFSVYCVVSSCFKVNCLNLWRSIRAYTLHQDLSLFVIVRTILQRLLQGVKGISPL